MCWLCTGASTWMFSKRYIIVRFRECGAAGSIDVAGPSPDWGADTQLCRCGSFQGREKAAGMRACTCYILRPAYCLHDLQSVQFQTSQST